MSNSENGAPEMGKAVERSCFRVKIGSLALSMAAGSCLFDI